MGFAVGSAPSGGFTVKLLCDKAGHAGTEASGHAS